MKQNLLELVYTTWLHNDFALACVMGMLVAVWLLLHSPSRYGVLLFLGFLLLLVRFEYLKHVVEPLMDQTTGILLKTEGTSFQERRVYMLFHIIVPFGLYLVGWGSLFAGMFLAHYQQMWKK